MSQTGTVTVSARGGGEASRRCSELSARRWLFLGPQAGGAITGSTKSPGPCSVGSYKGSHFLQSVAHLKDPSAPRAYVKLDSLQLQLLRFLSPQRSHCQGPKDEIGNGCGVWVFPPRQTGNLKGSAEKPPIWNTSAVLSLELQKQQNSGDLAPVRSLWSGSRSLTLLGLSFLFCKMQELDEMMSLKVLPSRQPVKTPSSNHLARCSLSRTAPRAECERSPRVPQLETVNQWPKGHWKEQEEVGRVNTGRPGCFSPDFNC